MMAVEVFAVPSDPKNESAGGMTLVRAWRLEEPAKTFSRSQTSAETRMESDFEGTIGFGFGDHSAQTTATAARKYIGHV